MATYDPNKTAAKEAAVRCGMRLKFRGTHGSVAHLVCEQTGTLMWSGHYCDMWQYLREHHNLQYGAH